MRFLNLGDNRKADTFFIHNAVHIFDICSVAHEGQGDGVDAEVQAHADLHAVLVLSDPMTGVPVGLLDAGPITAERTPAVSGVAIRRFGPSGGRTPVALIGAGVKIIFNYSEALLDVPADVNVHTSNPAVDLLYALYFHLN